MKNSREIKFPSIAGSVTGILQAGVFGLVALIIGACDPLDVQPTTLIPAEDAITDEKGLRAAVTGVYDGLQNGDISQDIMVFGDLSADNLAAVGSRIAYREVANNRINPNNIRMEGIWNAYYDVINRVNNILVNLDQVEGLSEGRINAYRGQILFIRALCHFDLVKTFGPVPVKTEPTRGISVQDVDVPRVAVDQVYDQIIADLEQAAVDLAGTGKGAPSQVSEGAVLALLSRAHLYEGNFGSAADYALQVMGLGYELVPGADYRLIFDETVETNENIFVIDFTDDDVNALADYFQPAARFEVGLTEAAYDMFTVDDFRASVAAPASSAEIWCDKYTDIANDSDHPVILRYAEILLTRAEALNELNYEAGGEAFSLLNEVRQRAGLGPLTAGDLPTQQSFRLAIEEERRKEFIGEGHRWYDLKRTGRALTVLAQKGVTSENQLFYPIPQSEIDTNSNENMTQNDGY